MKIKGDVMCDGKMFLTTDEAANFLGFTHAYLRKLCFMRQIPYFKPNGGRLLFERAELEAFIRASRVSSNDEHFAQAEALLNQGRREIKKTTRRE